ncbi:MAG: hypothetical protein KC621_30890 [Myxococcales bacterium]|nr:hypothetical protein [Myxococcales bacterium]
MIGLLLGAASAAPCTVDGAPDDAFRVRPSADRVLTIVEVWAAKAPAGWTDAVLDELDARGLAAMVVVPLGADADPDLLPVLDRVGRTEHDLAIVIADSEVPRDKRSQRALRSAVRRVEKASEPTKTVIGRLGSRTPEGLLGQIGFRSMADLRAVPSAVPRMAGHFEGMPRIDVVLAPGPYEDDCAEPRATPFLPAAADRVSLALELANRIPGNPTVRVAIVGDGGRDTDAAVLGRWLDEVLLPSRARIETAEGARAEVLAGFRKPTQAPDTSLDGRLVDVEQLRAGAAALAELTTLPRTVEDLSLTELFAGLVLMRAGRTEGSVVRLRALEGPATLAASTLREPVDVDGDALTAVASALVGAWPHEVPSAIRVGGQLLTASELLLALASAESGAQPIATRPVAVPDPNERGLGWGRSDTP